MKIKMIINPVSGQHKAHASKAAVIERLKTRYALRDHDIFYTSQENRCVETSFFDNCDSLVVAGGDGTLHFAVNTIKRLGIDVPLAYLPTGTVNDFGNSLKLPRTPDRFCEMLEKGKTKKIDIGLAGNEYFHYVVAGGAINSISYSTNQYLKNVMGEKAYYLSAVPKLPKILSGTHIKIECDELRQEQEALLYLVTNSPVIGGIEGMVPDAKMDDGQLHVLIIQKSSLFNTLQLFFDIKNGTHLNRPDVLYFRTKRLSITQYGLDAAHVGIDGEMYSTSLVHIEVIPRGITIMVPFESEVA
ncbi:diacylglycerol/lipid kinase family protein [Gorillibacterium timonense]|uniref:diacylglycerol/lipid kinase family protein n=1 Tax=Gorillibacterium timonense TaxID=1689269 RepID=UPI00071D58B1|nr:diacylglycerol kinase family protein [Gorillibacterium timonense]